MELSLRARFALALMAVTIVLIAVFATAMALFIEVLEHELLHDTLSRELAEHRDLLARDPDWPDLSGDQLTRIVVDQDDLQSLPQPLRDLGTRLEGEIEIEGRTYLVRATAVGRRRLILMLDIAPVEKLERNLAWAALLTALAGLLLAALLAVVLGRRLGR